MKVISHTGYDIMTIEVEEKPWWYPILGRAPFKEKYTGSHRVWRNSEGLKVDFEKSQALEDIWLDLRYEMDAARNRARGK